MAIPRAAEVRHQLLARKAELLDRQRRASRDAHHVVEALVADAPDQAIQRANDDVLLGIEDAAGAELAEIDLALDSIEQGRYGICRNCHAPIDPRRLVAVPYAVTCVHCAMAETALRR